MALERHPANRGGRAMIRIAIYLGLLGAVFCAAPARAAEMPVASLFFTPAQIEQIEAPPPTTAPMPTPPPADIHLGAVLYYGPGDWTLWIDGEKWTPDTRRADLQIVEVTPDEVHLDWLKAPNDPARAITLRPYQTYQVATGGVVEGIK